MARWTKEKSKMLKDKTKAFVTKKQAKNQAKMVAAQAKAVRAKAKSNLIQAKQSKNREMQKTLRMSSMAAAVASPWNSIINNNDLTGNYQTKTIGQTPETKDDGSNRDWAPRG